MTKIIQRHDTSTNWTSINPVLALGEMGIETDTNKFKFGDGVTNWTSLSYASAEGGGDVDLSNYYTKEETYDQEEIDTLLDEKQDVLGAIDPISIGSTTIGGPVNVNIVDGVIMPTYGSNPASVSYPASGTNGYVKAISNNSITTPINDIETLFSVDCSYFDVPVNFAEHINSGLATEIQMQIGGMNTFSKYYGMNFLLGEQTEKGFEPIIYGSTAFGSKLYDKQQTMIVNGFETSTSNGTCRLLLDQHYNTSNSSYSTFSGYRFRFIINASQFQLWNGASNGSTEWYTQLSVTKTNEYIAKFSKINVIRCWWCPCPSSIDINYMPTVDNTILSYGGVDSGWRITDGAITTYGVSLKYDNQTIQVNANGELVANLDELGNEVNTIASQVTANTTALGGNKIVSLTQAEYDGLATKDPNTVYIITDGPDGAYALADLSNVPSTVTSIAPTSLTNFDGQWVNVGGMHLNTSTAVGTYTIDLSGVLPNDGYNYDLLVGVTMAGQQSTFSQTWVGSDVVSVIQVGGCSAVTSDSINTFIIPVGQGRYLTKEVRNVAPSSSYLTLWAYRRLGTNQ